MRSLVAGYCTDMKDDSCFGKSVTQSHIATELPVEPRYTDNRRHADALFSGCFMQQGELPAHQSPSSVLIQGAPGSILADAK